MKTFYQYLDISQKASQVEIEAAYKRRTLETHPDRGGDSIEFQNVKKGYEILSNPVKRKEYDEWLKMKGYEENVDDPVSETDFDGNHKKPDSPKTSALKKHKKAWIITAIIAVVILLCASVPLYRDYKMDSLLTEADNRYVGNGVLMDREKSAQLYQEAADMGNTEAMVKLGRMYVNGYDGIPQNYNKAVELFKKASDLGNMDATTELGLCYDYGYGVKKDSVKAFNLYKQSAETMNGYGLFRLGRCYEYGIGAEKNETLSDDCFKKALPALTKISGDAKAARYIGHIYYYGSGVKQNYKQAVTWYLKSVKVEPQPEAQFTLGVCYDYGYGVKQNYSEAVKWYRKAAEQGHSTAQNNLGCFYEEGNVVDQDYKIAAEWYEKSAKQGNDWGQMNLGELYYYGNGVEQNYHKAKELLIEAAKNGNEPAKQDLEEWFFPQDSI